MRSEANYRYVGIQFLLEKTISRSSVPRDGVVSQMQYWSEILLGIWTKNAHSSHLKVDQNCILPREHKLSKGSNVHFWPRFEVRLDQKLYSRLTRDTELLQKLDWVKNWTPRIVLRNPIENEFEHTKLAFDKKNPQNFSSRDYLS